MEIEFVAYDDCVPQYLKVARKRVARWLFSARGIDGVRNPVLEDAVEALGAERAVVAERGHDYVVFYVIVGPEEKGPSLN